MRRRPLFAALALCQALLAPSSLRAQTPVADGVTLQSLEARIAQLESDLAAQAAASEPKPTDMDGSWAKNGWEAESENKDFRVHVGGRIQADAVGINGHDVVLNNNRDEDSVFFRRARLRVDGVMYETCEWAAEFDFTNNANDDPNLAAQPVDAYGGNVIGVPAPTDLWFAWHEVPVFGNVKVGSHKEPIGLEHLASSRFLDFMERSFLQDAYYGPFNNGFSPGISAYGWNQAETATYALGLFKTNQNVFGYDQGDSEYSLTGRLTATPYTACDGARLMHLGLGASYRALDPDADPARGNHRVRSRASLRNGPFPLNPTLADTNFTGRLFCDNEVLLAPEVAIVHGPWRFQSEYVASFANDTLFTPNGGAAVDLGQTFTHGAYVEALYFLTGEHSAYDPHEARFGRVVPRRNATFCGNGCGLSGPGAWQVGVRYGYLNLNDGLIQGGYIEDLTLGLNWFINPFAKWQLNYVRHDVQNTIVSSAGAVTAVNNGVVDGVGLRFAYDF